MSAVLSFPPFRLDPIDERLWRDGCEIPLRRKPFAILRYFAKNPHRLVTQQELVAAVWGQVATSDSLVRTHVHALRRAIGGGIVETVVGRGYRFVADVRTDCAPASVVVGRGDTVEALRAAWKGVGGDRPMILVIGEPGVVETAVAAVFAL